MFSSQSTAHLPIDCGVPTQINTECHERSASIFTSDREKPAALTEKLIMRLRVDEWHALQWHVI